MCGRAGGHGTTMPCGALTCARKPMGAVPHRRCSAQLLAASDGSHTASPHLDNCQTTARQLPHHFRRVSTPRQLPDHFRRVRRIPPPGSAARAYLLRRSPACAPGTARARADLVAYASVCQRTPAYANHGAIQPITLHSSAHLHASLPTTTTKRGGRGATPRPARGRRSSEFHSLIQAHSPRTHRALTALSPRTHRASHHVLTAHAPRSHRGPTPMPWERGVIDTSIA